MRVFDNITIPLAVSCCNDTLKHLSLALVNTTRCTATGVCCVTSTTTSSVLLLLPKITRSAEANSAVSTVHGNVSVHSNSSSPSALTKTYALPSDAATSLRPSGALSTHDTGASNSITCKPRIAGGASREIVTSSVSFAAKNAHS